MREEKRTAAEIAPEYKERLLTDICRRLGRRFSHGPYAGVDIKLGRKTGTKGRETVTSLTFRDGKGRAVTWSIADGTLDRKGNHKTANGAVYNILTGAYRQAARKAEKEWDRSGRALAPDRGVHR